MEQAEERDRDPHWWEQIRTLRKYKRITQQALADAVRCTRQEISKMENGHFRGGVKKVERVAGYLGCRLALEDQKTAEPDHFRAVRILAIDDDPSILFGYQRLFSRDESDGMHSLLNILGQQEKRLGQQQYELTTATSGEEGVRLMKRSLDGEGRSGFQLLLLDMRLLGRWDGLQTAQEMRKIMPEVKIIIISAYQDYSLSKLYEAIGSDFIFQSKPYSQEQLLQLVNYVLTH